MRFALSSRDARSQMRFPVSVRGEVSGSTIRRHQCEATDISTTGCRLASPFHYPVGSMIIITFPGLRALGSRVCWRNNEAVGVRFLTPLHGAVIDRIVSDCPAPAAAPAPSATTLPA